jgi:hypothetical protein
LFFAAFFRVVFLVSAIPNNACGSAAALALCNRQRFFVAAMILFMALSRNL